VKWEVADGGGRAHFKAVIHR